MSKDAPQEPQALEDDGNVDFEDVVSSEEEVVQTKKKGKKSKK